MQKFQVKAPGKVIIHGEHAVVYHKPAIAAAIGLSTNLQFRSQPESQVALFQLETLNCTLEIQVKEFNEFLNQFRAKHPNSQNDCMTKLLEEVRQEVSRRLEGSTVVTSAKQQHIQKAFTAIYYLLSGALLSSPQADINLTCGFSINIESEFNLGAGLGSSASFGAVLAASFLLLAKHFEFENALQDEHRALVSQWTFESERVMHGTPSGVDNTVCTYGGMLRFVKGQGFQQLNIQRPLNILLVDSRISRSTADIVAKVRHLSDTFPQVIDAIWNSCEQVVNAAVPLYESFGNSKDDSEKFEKLERLFQINNDLLKAIGVTHPKLEQIFSIAFKRGFFSKLTGAGAGGFAIVLLPDKYENNEVYWKLTEELKAAGFDVHATTAGGQGLSIGPLDD